MATFAAAFTVGQSADCTTLTLTDTSDYLTNSESYTKASFSDREFKIYNSADELIETLPMFDGDSDVTYKLTQDEWLKVELELTLVGSLSPDYTATHSVLSTCFLKLCFSELVAETECGCGGSGNSCNCDSTNNDKIRLLEYIKAAEIFSEYSNPVLAQKQLDAGTALCNANENN